MVSKKRFARAVIVVGVAGAVWWAWGSNKQDDFFSCNRQALDAIPTEIARMRKSADDDGLRNSIERAKVDFCMDARGYAFTGGGKECVFGDRSAECYSRKWWRF